MAENSELNSLELAKKQAEEKIKDLEKNFKEALQAATQELQTIESSIEAKKGQASTDSKTEATPLEKKDTEKGNVVKKTLPDEKKDVKTAAEKKKKEKEDEKLERKKKQKATEAKQLQNLKTSIANRTKGKVKAEPGNEKVRHTACEVFIFCVDDNELQLKVLVEQFKNTRSFKKAKGFTSGEGLLNYLKTRKFPKKSIILVVMDFFLENSDDEEAQNGISVLADLKEYDPDIEVIMLSGSEDVDVAASAQHFGAVTFIRKGNDAFKKVINNIVWTIREKEQIRKKADTKKAVKVAVIAFILFIVGLLGVDVALKGTLGIAWWIQKEVPKNETAAPAAVAPPETVTPE